MNEPEPFPGRNYGKTAALEGLRQGHEVSEPILDEEFGYRLSEEVSAATGLRYIAAGIRENGHLQGTGLLRSDQCCVVITPPYVQGHGPRPRLDDAVRHLVIDLYSKTGTRNVVRWSDSTPTREVLATLDCLAAELERAAKVEA